MNDYHCGADRRPHSHGQILLTLILGLLGVATIAWAIGISAGNAQTTLRPIADARFSGPPAAAPEPGTTFDGTVVRVIDGDTLIVETTTSVRVRLLDCWAPESRTLDLDEKTKGLKAKARLQELATGKPVRVQLPTHGGDLSESITLNRILGRVWLIEDGAPGLSDLSAQMVREGLALKAKPQ